MKTCVIANPCAGSAEDLSSLAVALLRLQEFTFRTTRSAADAEVFAREAAHDGFDRIIAAGGDGTLNRVVNGLARRFGSTVLGLIPQGTGNDFARSIGVPADPMQAVEAVLAGRTQYVDVVRIHNGTVRHFINVSGAGFTAEVGENISPAAKSFWGGVAYMWAAARTLPQLRPYEASVVLDDSERIELEAYNIIVANARFVGGGIAIAPQARIDDGKVDVIIVPALPMTSLLGLIPQMLNGTHGDHPELIVRRASKVHIQSRPAIPFNIDGEPMGDGSVTFETLHRVLPVIVGPQREEFP